MAHGVFCVYIDGLLMRLCESKVGCWIGNVHVGVLAYADDLTLLAPTPRTMRFLLKKYVKIMPVNFTLRHKICCYVHCQKKSLLS